MAIDRENRFLYVADSGNDVVDVFDADNFKLLRQIGKPSRKHDQTDPGTFSLPEGVAVDKDGNVYVTDTFNDRVEIFDADGEFISAFGKNGDGAGGFERPKGIAIDCDGHIWVVDAAQNRVKVFNQQGRLLIYFGGQGSFPGQFMGPWGIAIDPSNQVVVSETFPGRVQVFRYITDGRPPQRKRAGKARDRRNAGFRPARPSVTKPPARRAAAARKPKRDLTWRPRKIPRRNRRSATSFGYLRIAKNAALGKYPERHSNKNPKRGKGTKMKKLSLLVLMAFLAIGVAMAQNTPLPTAGTAPPLNPKGGFNTALGADVLGAHNGYGRGCVMCHAPHSGSLGNGVATSGDPQNGSTLCGART